MSSSVLGPNPGTQNLVDKARDAVASRYGPIGTGGHSWNAASHHPARELSFFRVLALS